MRSLKNKSNVIAPTATYPHGRIQDDDGSGTLGTPVDEQVYGDFHQFFQELMKDANLTPNEIAENEYDGFQLNTALGLFINKLILANGYQKDGPWYTSSVVVMGSGWADFGSPTFGFRLTKSGTCVQMRGGLQKTGALGNPDTVLTLPAGFRPSTARFLNGFQNQVSQAYLNVGTGGVIQLFGAGTGVSMYFDGIEFVL